MVFDVTDLFALGIGCDVAGAYLLARGLLLPPMALWQRSTIGGLEERFVDDAEDRAVATIGIWTLLGGFSVQAVGYALTLAVGAAEEPSLGRGLVAAGLSVAAAVAVLVAERRTRPRRFRRLVVRTARAGAAQNPQTSIHILLRSAARVGAERESGEADDAFVRRVFGADVADELEREIARAGGQRPHAGLGAIRIPFGPGDWQDDGEGGYELRIAPDQHGRQAPNVAVYRTGEAGLERVAIGMFTEADGTVVLHAATAGFAGEARVT